MPSADFCQALLLGIVQGLTEFLPVSSSGHLTLLLHLTGWDREKILPLVLALHLATLAAVLVYFRGRIIEILTAVFRFGNAAGAPGRRLASAVILGSAPTALIGLSLKDYFEKLFASPLAVAGGLAITGVFLLAAARISRRRPESPLSGTAAALIGVAQGIAIAPGISRSGATISAALAMGVARAEAFEFSFLLSIPANLGAMVLERNQLGAMLSGDILIILVSMTTAFGIGYGSLVLLAQAVRRGRIFPFGLYCLAASAISAALYLSPWP